MSWKRRFSRITPSLPWPMCSTGPLLRVTLRKCLPEEPPWRMLQRMPVIWSINLPLPTTDSVKPSLQTSCATLLLVPRPCKIKHSLLNVEFQSHNFKGVDLDNECARMCFNIDRIALIFQDITIKGLLYLERSIIQGKMDGLGDSRTLPSFSFSLCHSLCLRKEFDASSSAMSFIQSHNTRLGVQIGWFHPFAVDGWLWQLDSINNYMILVRGDEEGFRIVDCLGVE